MGIEVIDMWENLGKIQFSLFIFNLFSMAVRSVS